MADKLCLTIEQAAAELQISRSLAYAMVQKGELPAVRISVRRLVVPRKALEAYLEERVKSAGGANG